MWQVPSAFGPSLPRAPKDSVKLLKIYEHMSAPEKAIALFPLVQREYPKAFDLSIDSYARTGADVVRWLDRKSVVLGKSGSGRVVLGVLGMIKKKRKKQQEEHKIR